ncbi:hypothetical protein QYF36_009205 [Acer negundo]|nr:hypothetical protein QYF36_009205 [Acer negundo]
MNKLLWQSVPQYSDFKDYITSEERSILYRRPPGVGRVRGRYSREDGPGGRQPKGIGRRLDDRSAKVAEAEAEVDPLEIPVVSPNFAAVS